MTSFQVDSVDAGDADGDNAGTDRLDEAGTPAAPRRPMRRDRV